MNMNRGRAALLIALLAGSTYYGYSKYKTVTPSAAINNGVTDDMIVRRERGSANDKDRQQFTKALNLTPQQQAQMKELRKAGVEGRDRWTSMSAILTPQQRAQAQAQRDARRDKGAKATLSKGDFEKYKQKRDQMRASRPAGERGGRRG